MASTLGRSASARSSSSEDPFDGMLERSTVAQALRDARASLARPSRPYTPASRSLFQQPTYEDAPCSRPSSSYSIDQLRFAQSTFASSESRPTTRGSSGCAPIHEDEAMEYLVDPTSGLREPEPSFGNTAEMAAELQSAVSGSSGSSSAARKAQRKADRHAHRRADASLVDEYDAGAADDLALCMEVPPPQSDEESDEDGGDARSPTDASAGNAGRSGKPKCVESKGDLSETRRSRAAKGGEQGWLAAFQATLADLESFELGGDQAAAKPVAPLVQRVRCLVADLQGEASAHISQAPKLLRSVLVLMDCRVDATCLLRLARSALELLGMPNVVRDVGEQGIQAAYLNIVKALFKLSKDAVNDTAFREEGLLTAIGDVLLISQGAGASEDLSIYAVGILKNATNAEENQKYLAKQHVLLAALSLMKPENLQGKPKEAQLLIQITALLRNLSASSKRHQLLIDLDVLSSLQHISALYISHEELQINISRILAKLSLHDGPCQSFAEDPSRLQQTVACLSAHAGSSALVLRLAFVLGNFTARSDELRQSFTFQCDGNALLSSLIARYWQQDRKFAQAQASGAARSPEAQEVESVLVKLVRLVANVTISPDAGVLVASNPAIVEPLLEMLGSKKMPESEELVLNATAAVTNLLFYDSETNILFAAESKQKLCRILRPLLLESYNVEALVEAARALGNLSRHQDARQWMCELRIDEVLSILLGHDDRDLVFYVCGALVNLASEPEVGARLCRRGGVQQKLAAVLRDAPADDSELLLVVVKVLSNLRLDPDAEASWPEEDLAAVREGLQIVGGAPGAPSELTGLARGLLEAIAA